MGHFAFAIRTASSRANSEDRAEILEHDGSLIVVVADGAGGIAGGAQAGDGLIDVVRRRAADALFDPYDARAWTDVLRRADADLARTSRGETTAVVVVVGPSGVVGVSAGDSEAWIVGNRVDRLTENQDRHRLGTGRSRPTSFHRPTLEGALVVATDGLFRHARSESIAASARGGADEVADRLIELPKLGARKYPDDLALVVVSCDE